MHRLAEVWRPGGDGPPGSKTINESGGKTGGEAGIRTLDTAFRPYNGLANRRLQPLGHLTADAKCTEISTSRIEILHWRRRRFFRPPLSTDSAENRAFFAMRSARSLGTLAEKKNK